MVFDIRQRRLLEVLEANSIKLHQLAEEQDEALTELAQIMADDESKSQEIEDAVVELADMVGGDSNG